MKVNSNIQAMFAQSILSANEEKMAKSTQKMSSGYKLNRAMDNPAGMAITNRMRAQLSSLERATKNSKNAINAIQTAEGALSEIESMLQRMNELSIQGSNGTMSSSDRLAIQEEVDQLVSEINRISKNTTYNSQNLLDGTQDLKAFSGSSKDISVRNYNELMDVGKYKISVGAGGLVKSLTKDGATIDIAAQEVVEFVDKDGNTTGYSTKIHTANGAELTFETKGDSGATNVELDITGYGGMKIQVGAEEGQEIQVVIPEVSLRTLNFVDLDGNRTLDLRTEEGATKAISQIASAIDYVSAARSKLGAYQNRIENTVTNLDVTTENLTESYSTIKDIDMAEGMVEYTTLQVLIQAGTSMVAQANEQPQQALQLLQ
ncbi:MAG: flagellin [Lachnospiraceae bacterium]|nr:flagellin [Lachnospiraceae bacterium]MDY3254920.1 flagellin [Lachnospiraceae bacterium]MDY4837225.1 flagellin [Lachnospiraceae bacterium]